MNFNSKHILLEGKKSVNGLEVSHILGLMNWYDAKIACQKLGAGWRLPTIKELNMLFENKEEIGGFAHFIYWSSTQFDGNDTWLQSFHNGLQYYDNKDLNCYVRAVRLC
tara:strand:- start:92 stop:418 length:327 start_codon:yes stop_codon:yes gene_type:complete